MLLGSVFIHRVDKEGFNAKVAFMKESEGTKGANDETLWGENIPVSGKRGRKALRQESASRKNNKQASVHGTE